MRSMQADIESVRASAARAATNPALWPETLRRVSQLIGGDMTVMEHIDARTGAVTLGFNDRPDIAADTREAYERHFYAVNPRWDAARSLPTWAISDDDLIGDDRALDRFEYYVDFLGPSRLRYFMGAAVIADAEQTVILSIQRQPDRGRTGAAERGAFSTILPDLRNAMAMYGRIVSSPCGATLAAALDAMADPVAVVAEDGKLVFANASMQGLIARADVIRLCRRRLSGARDGMTRALAAAMRGALAGTGSAMASALTDLGPLIVRIAPIAYDRGREFAPGGERLLCLMIDDPARPHWPSVEDAMTLFGLTRREAMVGSHLAAGRGIDEIARRLRVSRNTVRSHLAVLRDKLGVRTSLAVAAEMRRAVGPFG